LRETITKLERFIHPSSASARRKFIRTANALRLPLLLSLFVKPKEESWSSQRTKFQVPDLDDLIPFSIISKPSPTLIHTPSSTPSTLASPSTGGSQQPGRGPAIGGDDILDELLALGKTNTAAPVALAQPMRIGTLGAGQSGIGTSVGNVVTKSSVVDKTGDEDNDLLDELLSLGK
jgi:hypothetical protein